MLFTGQYQDVETAAYADESATIHRPAIALNGFRTYDPFTGSYLQIDPLVESTWSTYVYSQSDPVGAQDPSGLAVCRPEGIGCTEEPPGEAPGYGYCSLYCKGACWVGLAPFCDCDACWSSGSTAPEPRCPTGCLELDSYGNLCQDPNGLNCHCDCPQNPTPRPPSSSTIPTKVPAGSIGGPVKIVCGAALPSGLIAGAAAGYACGKGLGGKFGTYVVGGFVCGFAASATVIGIISKVAQCGTTPIPTCPKGYVYLGGMCTPL
jgi:RHS repeat-associated protein